MEWSARVIFCDDIRQETNDKFLLVGVYQGALVSARVPVSVSLSTYMDIRGFPSGRHVCSVTALYEMEDDVLDLGNLTTTVDVRDGELPTILIGGGMNLVADKPGHVRILLGVAGSEPKLVDSLKVMIAPAQQT